MQSEATDTLSPLASRLQSLGYDAQRLATIADVDESTAYRWLAGGTTPYRKYLDRIASEADVSPEWLRTGQGDRLDGYQVLGFSRLGPEASKARQLPGGGPEHLGTLDPESAPPSRYANLQQASSTVVYELTDGDRVVTRVRVVVDVDPTTRSQSLSSRVESGA